VKRLIHIRRWWNYFGKSGKSLFQGLIRLHLIAQSLPSGSDFFVQARKLPRLLKQSLNLIVSERLTASFQIAFEGHIFNVESLDDAHDPVNYSLIHCHAFLLELGYDTCMRTPPSDPEFVRFTSAMRHIMRVPKAEIQRRMEAEKAGRRKPKPSVSRVSGASSKRAN
jgi:hypothetical protein